MNFAAIVARFAPPPPSVVKIAAAAGQNAVILNFKREWKTYMTIIAEKLDAAHGRRTELAAERKGLLLDSLQGEPGTEQKLRKIENEIADLDRTVGQLRDANELARERDDAEREAAAAAEYKRLKAEWRQRNADMRQLAEQADALASKTAATFTELAEKAEAQARSAPVELRGLPAERPLGGNRAALAARNVLARHGLAWAHSGVFRWPAPPLITEVIDAGITWAEAEVVRAESRKNAP